MDREWSWWRASSCRSGQYASLVDCRSVNSRSALFSGMRDTVIYTANPNNKVIMVRTKREMRVASLNWDFVPRKRGIVLEINTRKKKASKGSSSLGSFFFHKPGRSSNNSTTMGKISRGLTWTFVPPITPGKYLKLVTGRLIRKSAQKTFFDRLSSSLIMVILMPSHLDHDKYQPGQYTQSPTNQGVCTRIPYFINLYV